MLHFSPPTHRCMPPAPRTVAPLTPAAYLRLRRKAAGVSIANAARRLAPNNVGEASALIALLETDGAAARYVETLHGLRDAFPFDVDLYVQLRDAPADAHPRVCRGCGCSHWNPCVAADDTGTCGWASDDACTRCAGDPLPITVHQ